MKRLYEENELLFAICWIVIYVIGFSLADNFSVMLGCEKSLTAVVGVFMSFFLFRWIKKHQLFEKYGLCKSKIGSEKMLYYIPLVFMVSVNLWNGFSINLSVAEIFLYVISMLAVGFLEEIIFRGFLFLAMCKDGVKSAIIVSSVTFGIGHIVNFVNGSGVDLLSNLLQVGYAIAAGFLFTIIFYKSKSLVSCIVTHGVLNALSVFANEKVNTVQNEMMSAITLAGISLFFAIYILKQDKLQNNNDRKE